MNIFTKEWVQQIRNRYEKLPESQRPSIYFIATSPDFQHERDEVEKWLVELPTALNKDVTSRLSGESGYVQMYHELAVGYLIKQFGYLPEYAKNLGDNLTPDWYVQPTQGKSGFIVELFTANTSEVERKQDKQRNDLFARLHQIPINVTLNIRFHKVGDLDQKQNKDISHKISSWLKNKPTVGSELNWNGIIFKIHENETKYPNVQFIGAYSSYISTERLKENIKDKIRKYEKITREMQIPLVVGIVAAPRTGFCLANIYDVLLGQDAQQFDYINDELIATRAIRMPNGMFSQEPALSAVLWIWRDEITKVWQIRTLRSPNPGAINPLPVDVFN